MKLLYHLQHLGHSLKVSKVSLKHPRSHVMLEEDQPLSLHVLSFLENNQVLAFKKNNNPIKFIGKTDFAKISPKSMIWIFGRRQLDQSARPFALDSVCHRLNMKLLNSKLYELKLSLKHKYLVPNFVSKFWELGVLTFFAKFNYCYWNYF